MKTLKSISLLLLLVPACGQDMVGASAGGATSGNGGASSSTITSHVGGAMGTGGNHGAGGNPNGGGASNTASMTNLGGTSNANGATGTDGMSHLGGSTGLGGTNSAGGADAIGGATTTGGANATGGAIPMGGTDAGCVQALVELGAAVDFVVLAGSTVTSTGPTSVTGDLGVSPGTAVTGFGPGTIVGAQHVGDPTAAQGEADLTTAYNDAAGRMLCAVTISGNLGGQTLTPGLYKSTSSLEISSGDLTLDAQGNADAVFIFQMQSTLTTTAGRQVILSGAAKSTNVFWQVGTSATLGSTSVFQGTVMADQAITMDTAATLNGRVLARVAAVTLDSNTIVKSSP